MPDGYFGHKIKWDEPYATVFLEAMGAGKAVITANDGGINDYVRDGIHGYTVPPKNLDAAAEALDKMLSNTAERERMCRNAAQLFEESLTSRIFAVRLVNQFLESTGLDRQKFSFND